MGNNARLAMASAVAATVRLPICSIPSRAISLRRGIDWSRPGSACRPTRTSSTPFRAACPARRCRPGNIWRRSNDGRLVYYIKSLAEKPLEIKAQKMPAADGSGGEGIIEVPKPLPFDAAARARALELYKDACASCHGDTGRGDGAQEQKDDEGFPTRPRDLTAGVFKGSPDPIALYRHIVAGIPGSPMPMSDWAYGAGRMAFGQLRALAFQ